MAEHGNVIPVQNETMSTISRITARGKRLTYRLKVIQQPQRARACGSGAKSSADRRPVDPPPIVELKIFEGEPNNEEDITLNMNASYFLFAALEQARPIAQGRVPEDKDRVMALTGSSVAGMAYLDRPTPAGYFIFPDLSVRHEGKYRLSFSLYEGLKDPLDFDKTDETALPAGPDTPAHVSHRLEVKSEPFIVFSAKKFPGLTESTSLSRMVAEQGCRVRIRRDVRMRKRESKPGKDWDDYEDETAAVRASTSATPDASHHSVHVYMDAIPRPRSASNTSQGSVAASLSRRPSNSEMASQFHGQHFPGVPRMSQPAYPPSSPYNHSAQHFAQATIVAPDHTAMQPPPPQYVQQQQQTYPSANVTPGSAASAHSLPQQNGYFAHPGPMSSTPAVHYAAQPAIYDAHASSPRANAEFHDASNNHSQSQTSNQYAMQPQTPNNYVRSQATQLYASPVSNYTSQHTYPTGQHQQLQQSRAQVNAPQNSSRYVSHDDRIGAGLIQVRPDKQLPPLQIPDHSSFKPIEPSSPTSSSQLTSHYTANENPHKRGYGHVFNDRHLNQSLRDGARPNLPMYAESQMGHLMADFAADDADGISDIDPSRMPMRYRRADGSSIVRELPPQTKN